MAIYEFSKFLTVHLLKPPELDFRPPGGLRQTVAVEKNPSGRFVDDRDGGPGAVQLMNEEAIQVSPSGTGYLESPVAFHTGDYVSSDHEPLSC